MPPSSRSSPPSDAEGAWDWKTAYDACEAAQVLFLRRFGPAMRARAGSPPVAAEDDTAAFLQRDESASPNGINGFPALDRLAKRNRPWPLVWRWPLVMAPSVSRRRAIVERKRFSAFTLVAIGRNRGGWAWLVRFDRPRP
jgi:hypothetical protein